MATRFVIATINNKTRIISTFAATAARLCAGRMAHLLSATFGIQQSRRISAAFVATMPRMSTQTQRSRRNTRAICFAASRVRRLILKWRAREESNLRMQLLQRIGNPSRQRSLPARSQRSSIVDLCAQSDRSFALAALKLWRELKVFYRTIFYWPFLALISCLLISVSTPTLGPNSTMSIEKTAADQDFGLSQRAFHGLYEHEFPLAGLSELYQDLYDKTENPNV